jgi:CLIP-associating protein 1/2
LEDGDAHVRECARESVVEIFTGPGVTDGARADLKAAMTKKGVRKGIIESVLSRLVPGSDPMGASHLQSEGSENGEGSEKGKEYVPPSMLLQGKKPSAGPTAGPSAMITTSQISPTETSRPASRAAANPSSDTAGTSAADVRAVYVRILSSTLMAAELIIPS